MGSVQQNIQDCEQRYDAVPGIFALMKLIEGAMAAIHKLAKQFDVYVLSTAP